MYIIHYIPYIVWQPLTTDFAVDGSVTAYCANLVNTGATRIIANQALFQRSKSPTAGVLYSIGYNIVYCSALII